MLRLLSELIDYSIHATDGDLGHCSDFLVDDEAWTIRYLVVKTTRWLPGRKIVLPPVFLDEPDWDAQRFPARLTKQQIEDGPPLDEHAPLSRQYEVTYHEHYALPFYWLGESRLETYPDAHGVLHPVPDEPVTELAALASDEKGHLRSTREMTGYRVFAARGEVGHVADFVLDDQASWVLRYLVVDTGAWLPGRKVLLSTQWITSVRWTDRVIHIDAEIESIAHSPVYDPSQGLTRSYEMLLHDHYRQRYYWT